MKGRATASRSTRLTASLSKKLDGLQAEATRLALQDLRQGGRALVVLPTGAGKTRVGGNIIKKFIFMGQRGNRKKKVIWITHKHDLSNDVCEIFGSRFPDKRIGKFVDGQSIATNDIVVATIQTIHKPHHLSQLDVKRVGLVVVDEGHHAPAGSYRKFLQAMKGVPCVALTATHMRPDDPEGDPQVEQIFGRPSIQRSIGEAIELGIYADPRERSRVILTKSVIDGLPGQKGEYSKGQLDRAVVSKERDDIVLKSYLKYGRKPLLEAGKIPKAIGYAVNVRHAERMARKFRKRGIKSKFIVGDNSRLSIEERTEILRRFKRTNEIEVLWAVDLLNEGSDIPDVNCLLMARPTRSNIVYTQQLGRGARVIDAEKSRHTGKPEKYEMIVLDYADNTRRGFHNYSVANVLPGQKYKRHQIITEYAGSDPVEINERVDVLQTITGYEKARANFYPTAEEAYEACRKLPVDWTKGAAHRLYGKHYKNDPRLPGDPFDHYRGVWRWSALSGRPGHDLEKGKAQLREFCIQNNRVPKIGGSIEERRLAVRMADYRSRSSPRFDPEFLELSRRYGYTERTGRAWEEKWLPLAEAFYRQNQKLPSIVSKDQNERQLANSIKSFIERNPRAKRWARRHGYGKGRERLRKHTLKTIKCLLREKKYPRIAAWIKDDNGRSHAAARRCGWLPALRREFFPSTGTGRQAR
jgi:superfamily II DNA or RNA helicase